MEYFIFKMFSSEGGSAGSIKTQITRNKFHITLGSFLMSFLEYVNVCKFGCITFPFFGCNFTHVNMKKNSSFLISFVLAKV